MTVIVLTFATCMCLKTVLTIHPVGTERVNFPRTGHIQQKLTSENGTDPRGLSALVIGRIAEHGGFDHGRPNGVESIACLLGAHGSADS